MSLNLELLKTELFKAPFIELASKQLEEGDEIIAILVAGSQSNSLATKSSDIDISIKTLKTWDLEPPIVGEFQGQPLHWWITPLAREFICWEHPKYMGLIMTGDYYMNYSSESILYLNPKYASIIEFMHKSHSLIQKCSVYHLIRLLKKRLNWSKQAASIPFSKLFAPLVDFYYVANNLPINISLIQKAKSSIKSTEVILTEEENKELKIAIEWTIDYCNKNSYPIEEMLEWYKEFNQILASCKN